MARRRGKELAFKISAEDKEALRSIRNLVAGFQSLMAPIDKVNRRLRANQRALRPMLRRIERWQDKVKDLGTSLSIGVSAPITAAGYFGAQLSSEFEHTMTKVKAISGATNRELQQMTEAAKAYGAATQFTMSEVGEGLLSLSYAGYDTGEKLNMIPGVLDLTAIADDMPLGQVAEFATNVMAGFNAEAEKFTRIADKITYGFTNTKTNFQDFHDSIAKVAGVAKSVNVEFDETAAIIMALAKKGHRGPEAGSALASGLMRVIDLTPEAEFALARLSIYKDQVLDDDGKIKDFVGFLDLLKKQGAQTKDYVQIFGMDPAKYLLSIVDEIKMIRDFEKGLKFNSIGLASKKAKEMMKDFQGSLKLLQSASQGFVEKFFDSGPLKFLEGLTDGATELMRALESLSPETHRFLAVLGGVAAVVGPVMLGVAGIMGALKGLVSLGVAASLTGVLGVFALFAAKVVLITTAIASLVYGGYLLIQNWDYIKQSASSLWANLRATFPAIPEFFDTIYEGAANLASSIVGIVSEIGTGLLEMYRLFVDSDFFKLLSAIGENIFQGIKFFLGMATTLITKIVGGLFSLLTNSISFYLDHIKGVIKANFGYAKSIMDFFMNNRFMKYLADKVDINREATKDNRLANFEKMGYETPKDLGFKWAPDFISDKFEPIVDPVESLQLDRLLSLGKSDISMFDRSKIFEPRSRLEKLGMKNGDKNSRIDLNLSFDNLPSNMSVSSKARGTPLNLSVDTGLVMEGAF